MKNRNNKGRKTNFSVISFFLSLIAIGIVCYSLVSSGKSPVGKSTSMDQTELKNLISQQRSRLDDFKNEFDTFSQELETTKGEIESLKKSTSSKAEVKSQDSAIIEIQENVNQLKKDFSGFQKEFNEIKNLNDSSKKNGKLDYLSLAALVIGIIALLYALFFGRGLKEEEIINIVNNRLDGSFRLNELEQMKGNLNALINSQKNNSYRQSNNINQSTESQIFKLNSDVKAIIDYLNSKVDPVLYPKQANTLNTGKTHRSTNDSAPKQEYKKVGYAKINSDKFFTNILDSNVEGCVFKITFNSSNKGEFTIISLEKIKSRNDWQQIVEYTGSIDDAKEFRVDEIGICEKYDESSWQVTKPLKIRLLK